MRGVDIVLHAAALKHVGLCEDSPAQAIATNIQGTQNVIDAAQENGVERVIFTSSDKAVNPTNVMGTSKLMGERLMTAAAETTANGLTCARATPVRSSPPRGSATCWARAGRWCRCFAGRSRRAGRSR